MSNESILFSNRVKKNAEKILSMPDKKKFSFFNYLYNFITDYVLPNKVPFFFFALFIISIIIRIFIDDTKIENYNNNPSFNPSNPINSQYHKYDINVLPNKLPLNFPHPDTKKNNKSNKLKNKNILNKSNKLKNIIKPKNNNIDKNKYSISTDVIKNKKNYNKFNNYDKKINTEYNLTPEGYSYYSGINTKYNKFNDYDKNNYFINSSGLRDDFNYTTDIYVDKMNKLNEKNLTNYQNIVNNLEGNIYNDNNNYNNNINFDIIPPYHIN